MSLRVQRELIKLKTDLPQNFSIHLIEEHDLFHYQITIPGPERTYSPEATSPYRGGRFKIEVVLPSDYPMSPPVCKFITKVYHPNISFDGLISLNILHNRWSPALTLRYIMLGIQQLLEDPNPEQSLNSQVAYIYKTDLSKYLETAKQWTIKYAK